MKAVNMETTDDGVSQTSDEPLLSLQIYVPELHLQKSFHFSRDELIWDVKQTILASLPKELKESFNYGLFCPPVNGKAGKFLDEERPLGDYPLNEQSAYLELRYKRRVYKIMNVEEKQIKQLHTRANLKRMLEHVVNGNVEKITKLCSRGLDPNFHCPETGETPLTLAAGVKNPGKIILALVNGGALLDFRTKDGRTALHRAVEKNNYDGLKTLLDLGASPNYKDSKGLTSLYYSVLYGCEPQLTELLLHDHATIGVSDPQGWQEVHQACKHGLVQHLEHLLFYGADMNAHNASGNTPLHVCAVNDQESCARVLLFRGADKESLNYANQNPYQVAVIAGNLSLAEIIQNHRPEDVVPYREAPRYNPRRRASCNPAAMSATLSRTHSDPRLELVLGPKPPSPCPSNRSLPPFSSSVSTISEASTGSSSTCTHPSGDDSEDTASASIVTDKSLTSDSSGVCTSNSGNSYDDSSTGGEFPDPPDDFYLAPAAMTCVCIQDYCTNEPDHLQLAVGDLVHVTAVSDSGMMEGIRRDGQEGVFPSSCVQEVKLRHADTLPNRPRVEGRRELNAKKVTTMPRRWRMYGEPRTVILHKGKKGFGFVLRGAKATSPLMERQPTEYWPSLQYLDDVDKGGVADMAGLKKGDFLLEINGEDVSQASHEHVVAIIRQSGDLVAMTVVTVQGGPPAGTPVERPSLAHRQCSTLPRKLSGKKAPVPPKRDPRTTLSVGRARARSMVAGLADLEVLDRTLNEYDSEGRSTKSSSIESIPNKQGSGGGGSSAPEGEPAGSTTNGTTNQQQKVASIRARPSSRRLTSAELEEFFARQQDNDADTPTSQLMYGTLSTRSTSSGGRTPKVYGSVAAMKRSRATRAKAVDVVSKLHKDFHSTPDLNADASDSECNVEAEQLLVHRSQSQEDVHSLNVKNCRHSWACPPHTYTKQINLTAPLASEKETNLIYRSAWKSIEEIYDRVKKRDQSLSPPRREEGSRIYAETLPIPRKDKSSVVPRASCPPPTHPPPPPPVGQVVKVDVSKSMGEYANVTIIKEPKTTVMSSFRPGDSAKLYASPDTVVTIGYKSDQYSQRSEPTTRSRRSGSGSSTRSHSLPPKIPSSNGKQGNRSNTSSEAETSGDSGGIYSAFKANVQRSRDSHSSDSGHVSEQGTLKSLKGKGGVVSAYSSTFRDSDSDAGSPHHYPPLGGQHNEPFIPEPDYDSSEEEEIPTSVDMGGSLTTFKGETGRGDTPPPVHHLEEETSSLAGDDLGLISPHTEAKRAIQEAREKLRRTQKGSDTKSSNVVFISTVDLENNVKVERTQSPSHINSASVDVPVSESPVKPKDSSAMIVPQATAIIAEDSVAAIENETSISRPSTANGSVSSGSRDTESTDGSTKTGRSATDSVTSSPLMNHKSDMERPPSAAATVDIVSGKVRQNISVFEKKSETAMQKPPTPLLTHRKNSEGLCGAVAVAGAQVQGSMKTSKSCPKDFMQEELEKCENSSSGVSSDMETQSDCALYAPAKAEQVSKMESTDTTSSSSIDSQVQRIEKRAAPSSSPEVKHVAAANVESQHPISKVEDTIKQQQSSESDVHSLNRRNLTKNAVSLRNLPPPAESNQETDSEQDLSDYSTLNSKGRPSPLGKQQARILQSKSLSSSNLVLSRSNGQQRASTLQRPPSSRICDSPIKSSLSATPTPTSTEADDAITVSKLNRELEESLEMVRVQVNSLGLAAVNEVDVFTELVPPPPEFAAPPAPPATPLALSTASAPVDANRVPAAALPVMIAPPPEFSDESSGNTITHHQTPSFKSATLSRVSSSTSDSCRRSTSPDIHHINYSYMDYSYRTSLGAKMVGSPQRSAKSAGVGDTLRKSATGAGTRDVPSPQPGYHGNCEPPPHHRSLVGGGGDSGPSSYPSSGKSARELVAQLKSVQREFRHKPLQEWSGKDVADWLESLFLQEYKSRFAEAGITGAKLANMDNNDFVGLGVKQVGHRLNMERSLRRYLK